MNKSQTAGIWIVIVFLILALAAMLYTGPATSTEQVSYTKFIEQVKNHEIKSVEIAGQTVTATPIKQPTVNEKNPQVTPPKLQIRTQIPMNDSSLYPTLEENNVDISVRKPAENNSLLLNILFPVIVFVIIIAVMSKIVQAGGSQAMSFGKSKAKLMLDNKVKVTFKDVAGIDEERQELSEIVDFLKNGEKYLKLGAKIPKGVLLVGPPGTGKTLMAKAVAGEAGVPFFSISGSDFVEMFVGVGASRVRDLFDTAKASAPCIVFIDEIDAVGRQRGAGLGGGNDEREQTLNQMLVEMDGFESNSGIIVLAATNRADVLDPALTRPGRFDRQVYVHLPDVKGREEILKVHAKNKPLSDDVDFKRIAR